VAAVHVRGGAGKTRWIRPGWTTADTTADVHAAVTQLGPRRPAIAGCSMGSITGSGRLLKDGCDRVEPLRDQLRVRPGIPPSPYPDPRARRCGRGRHRPGWLPYGFAGHLARLPHVTFVPTQEAGED